MLSPRISDSILTRNCSAIYFMAKTLKSLEIDYQEANEEYQRTQSGLAQEVVNIACKYLALQTVV